MGRSAEGNKAIFSLELCGGTHVARTGDIGLIKVVGEGASAAGVRRIEALAGPAAKAYLDEQDRKVASLAHLLKTTPDELEARVSQLVEERRKLERELAETRKKLAMGGGGKQATEVEDIGGVKFIGRVVPGIDPKDLKGLADEGKAQVGSGVVVLVAVSDDGKGAAVVGVTNDLTGRLNAVELVKRASAALGGRGGGGRPDMAQAGGPDGAKADAALAAVREAIAAVG
jgi:alanyl-tRNA synthetase